MTPVLQTPDHPVGNCLQAAIASVLDLSLEGVPDFASTKKFKTNRRWVSDIARWAAERGLGFVYHRKTKLGRLIHPALNNVWVVAIGDTDRNPQDKSKHAVVCRINTTFKYRRNGDSEETIHFHYVHDPAGGDDFLTKITGYLFFVPTSGATSR